MTRVEQADKGCCSWHRSPGRKRRPENGTATQDIRVIRQQVLADFWLVQVLETAGSFPHEVKTTRALLRRTSRNELIARIKSTRSP